jgi:phosphoglycolate phosphatase-like HAD superfamily hydrolase
VDALETAGVTPLLLELDGVLGDTRPLWADWLEGTSHLFGLDPDSLPYDRAAAAAALDERGAGNWRVLLERFASERAPVYLRPDAAVSNALRSLASAGTRLGVFTDAPEELARVAVAQLGAGRRIEALECGTEACDRLRARLGAAADVVATKAELLERVAVDSRQSH